MSTSFWIKRFVAVLAGAFAVIVMAQLLKGHDAACAATHAGIWGMLSALVCTVARFFQASAWPALCARQGHAADATGPSP